MARKKTSTAKTSSTRRPPAPSEATKPVKKKTTKRVASRATKKKAVVKTTTRTTTRASKARSKVTAKAAAATPTAKSSPKRVVRKKSASNVISTGTPGKAGKVVISKEAKRSRASASRNGASQGETNGDGKHLTVEQLRKIKTGLSKKELAYFRSLLLEKRGELIGDVESLQSDARNGGGGISYEHMADVGTDSYEQEFALGLAESERKILTEIDDALGRMVEGFYGVCVESGKPIDKPRLEIKPWAKYCIDVARERERRGLG